MEQNKVSDGHRASWDVPVTIGDRFVGREQELADLWERLDRALQGRGQVAFVRGQAGSGKTALVFHFLRRARSIRSDFAVAIGGCNAQTGIGDPYLPFREALVSLTWGTDSNRRLAGLPDAGGGKVGRAALARSAQILVEVAPDLIGLFVPGASLVGAVGKAVAEKLGWVDKLDELAEPRSDAAADQSHIFEQYSQYLLRLSEQVPVLIFVDDLQWADSASLGLFFHLARRIEGSRVMLLGAYRGSDVAVRHGGQRHPLQQVIHEMMRYYGNVIIDLNSIPEAVNRHFIDALVDAEPNRLDDTFRQALYNHTQGHALFTVELLEMMRRQGSLVQDKSGAWVLGAEVDWRALPPRIDGIIGERMDRLDDELRETLTIASVEGESFTAEVVARIQEMGDREMVRKLSHDLADEHRLVGPEGTARVGPNRLSIYRFMHSLFQQYLYEGLSEAERAYLHEDVGSILETLYQNQTDEIAAQLARHFALGGLKEKAANYHLQAARRALRLSGHPEAISHAQQGLGLLYSQNEKPKGDELMLGLEITLAAASISSNGYNCPQARSAFKRAHQLAQEIGEPKQELAALHGLSFVSLLRGDLPGAHDFAAQLMARAEELGAGPYVIDAEVLHGAAEMYLGHLDRARAGFESALAKYDVGLHGHLAPVLTWDPGVAAQAFLALVLWQQGFPQQALGRAQAALDLARRLNHPFSTGVALSFLAMVHHLRGESASASRYAREALEMGRERTYYAWEATGGVAEGLALAQRGRYEDAVSLIEQSLLVWADAGANVMTDYFETVLAEVYLLAGNQQAGLRTLDADRGPREATWWQSERLRMRAQLLLTTPGHEDAAESLLNESVTHARTLGDHGAELRSALALVDLLRGTERASSAVEDLERVYATYAEGFDTPDLIAACERLGQCQVPA